MVIIISCTWNLNLTVQREWDTQTLLVFRRIIGSPNFVKMTRRNDSQQQKKRNCWIVDFSIPADHRTKLKEGEKRNKYVDLARELKQTKEHERNIDTNCSLCSWNNPQRIGKETGRLGKKRTIRDYPDYSIKNTKRLEETCCHSNSNKKKISYGWCEKLSKQ